MVEQAIREVGIMIIFIMMDMDKGWYYSQIR